MNSSACTPLSTQVSITKPSDFARATTGDTTGMRLQGDEPHGQQTKNQTPTITKATTTQLHTIFMFMSCLTVVLLTQPLPGHDGAVARRWSPGGEAGTSREAFLEFFQRIGGDSPWIRRRSPELVTGDRRLDVHGRTAAQGLDLGARRRPGRWRSPCPPRPHVASIGHRPRPGRGSFLSLYEFQARGAGLGLANTARGAGLGLADTAQRAGLADTARRTSWLDRHSARAAA